MQSNFDSEIRKTSKALITFSPETNLILIELIFRWTITIFKVMSIKFTNMQNAVIYRKARFRAFCRKTTMTSSKQIMLVLRSNWVKFFKKFINILTKADMSWSLSCKIFLFNCRLKLVLLWQLKSIFSSVHVSFKSLFTPSAFSL